VALTGPRKIKQGYDLRLARVWPTYGFAHDVGRAG
jgi:hypothetical protein